MSYHYEVERMKKIAKTLTKQIDDFMSVTYIQTEIVQIIKEYFPEGAIALSQGVDLIIVLKDFKKICEHIPLKIDETDFDKIKKAVIDYEYNKRFSFK